MMYDPQARLYQFVPSRDRQVSVVSLENSVQKSRSIRKNLKTKKIVFIHVVNTQQLYDEFEQSDRTKTIRQLCALLESKRHHIFFGEAKTPVAAEASSMKFGVGNLIVYAALHNEQRMPQYLAIGKTNGCRVEGKKMYGTFEILSAFGGHDNPYTQHAIEYHHQDLVGRNQFSAQLHWDVLPRRPLYKLLKCCFVKPYLAKFGHVYSELQGSESVKQIVQRLPVDARGVLLIRLLFTYSEEAVQVFLQTFQC